MLGLALAVEESEVDVGMGRVFKMVNNQKFQITMVDRVLVLNKAITLLTIGSPMQWRPQREH